MNIDLMETYMFLQVKKPSPEEQDFRLSLKTMI